MVTEAAEPNIASLATECGRRSWTRL